MSNIIISTATFFTYQHSLSPVCPGHFRSSVQKYPILALFWWFVVILRRLVFLSLYLQGGQSAPWLLVVTLRYAFPLWQVPQVAGGHRQEP